jgi:hypothetical protein
VSPTRAMVERHHDRSGPSVEAMRFKKETPTLRLGAKAGPPTEGRHNQDGHLLPYLCFVAGPRPSVGSFKDAHPRARHKKEEAAATVHYRAVRVALSANTSLLTRSGVPRDLSSCSRHTDRALAQS